MWPFCSVAAEQSFWDRVGPSAVGALIGLAGLFTVWWLTQRATRRRESEARSAESVTLVIDAISKVPRDLPQVIRTKNEYAVATREVSHALNLFGTREIREFPDLAGLAFSHAWLLGDKADELMKTDLSGLFILIGTDIEERLAAIKSSLIWWLEKPKSEGLPAL